MSRRSDLVAAGCLMALTAIASRADAMPTDGSRCLAVGNWQGTLAGLRLVFHLSEAASGGWRATLDSPDQGATGIPVDSVWCTAESLYFECRGIGGSYAGRVAGADRLAGEWRQRGFALPLGFARTERLAELRRPQDPTPPFPYDADSVRYENRRAGIRLAGTLTVPRTPGPHPAVLLISGSGPQDRDETVFGHRPFRVIADALTRRGLAVLRVDDRGIGSSTGRFAGATLEDFASDAVAGVEFLRTRTDIDPRRIGLVGHSEGGLVAPMVAAGDRRVAFVALLAAPGVTGDELLLMQGDALRRAAGIDSARRARETALQRDFFATIRGEPDSGRAAGRARALIEKRLAEMSEIERQAVGNPGEFADAQIRLLLSPWFRGLLDHDPRPQLRRVRCPVLAMNGGKDLQVPAGANLGEIGKALRAGGNRDVTIREFPGLNHLFQTAATGQLGEYGTIEETFAPAALDTLGAWLAARAGLGR